MSVTSDPTIPDYIAGTWTIDPVHSEIGFSVCHMMVSKVRGRFTTFSGDIVTGESPLDSSVTATIDLSSIETGNPDRDNHIRSADFFEVDKHKTMSFRSTGVRRDGEDYVVDGELTLKTITKPISLRLELGGFGPDPYGGTRTDSPRSVSSTAATSGSTSTPSSKPVAWSWVTRWTSFSRSKRC